MKSTFSKDKNCIDWLSLLKFHADVAEALRALVVLLQLHDSVDVLEKYKTNRLCHNYAIFQLLPSLVKHKNDGKNIIHMYSSQFDGCSNVANIHYMHN